MQLSQLKVTDPGGGGLFTYDVTTLGVGFPNPQQYYSPVTKNATSQLNVCLLGWPLSY
jgi:hypothetical protein